MTPVELQKCVIVSHSETPYQFDIAYLDWLYHLPRLEISLALTL
jgi:hypothetical protein